MFQGMLKNSCHVTGIERNGLDNTVKTSNMKDMLDFRYK